MTMLMLLMMRITIIGRHRRRRRRGHVLKAEAESAFLLVDDYGCVDAGVADDRRDRRQVGVVSLLRGVSKIISYLFVSYPPLYLL